MGVTSETVYQFKESLKAGEKGENTIIDFLLSKGQVIRIEDVRNHKGYQENDIDIIVVDKNRTRHSCEIKTDSYTSGNLFYETLSCVETGSIGCIEKTKADCILYYFENLHKLYILPADAFRRFFRDYQYMFRRASVKNYRHNGDIYTTEGYLIPLNFLEKNMGACRTVNL